MLKKVVIWGLVLFVVYYLATNPTGAAHITTNGFHLLGDAGRSLKTFVNSL